MNTLVIYHPNTAMAEVQTKVPLLDKKYSSETTPDDAPAEMIRLEKAVNCMRGVKSVRIGRHDINLEKWDVFNWDEIIPAVLDALKTAISIDLDVTYDDRRSRRPERIGDDY